VSIQELDRLELCYTKLLLIHIFQFLLQPDPHSEPLNQSSTSGDRVLTLEASQLPAFKKNLDLLQNLLILDLSNLKLQNCDFLLQADSLRRLNLKGNLLSSTLFLVNNKQLQTLDLSFNQIAGIEQLQCLSHLQLLQELVIWGNPIVAKKSIFYQIYKVNQNIQFINYAYIQLKISAGSDEHVLDDSTLVRDYLRIENMHYDQRKFN
jgi:hypothetical protein